MILRGHMDVGKRSSTSPAQDLEYSELGFKYILVNKCFAGSYVSFGSCSRLDLNMPDWTHLIRFIAVEDEQIHLGQLVDTSRDVGLDSVKGVEIKAYLINGDVLSGKVTKHVYTVKRLLSPVDRDQCNYIRCLGLNYKDHAEVRCDYRRAQIY